MTKATCQKVVPVTIILEFCDSYEGSRMSVNDLRVNTEIKDHK